MNQFRREGRKPISLPFRGPDLNAKIPTIDIAELAKTFPERGNIAVVDWSTTQG